MDLIKPFHLIALILLLLYGVLAFHRISSGSIIYWPAFGAYLVLVIGLYRNNRWCARLAVIPPALVFLFSTVAVLYNLAAFAAGDPRYQDSPATIIVVGIFAVMVTGPSGAVVWAYWANRDEIFKGK